jgi:uncharacterized protein (TIGR00369 family)
MTGLEFFQALARGDLPPQPITATIGWTVMEAQPGRLTLGFEPQDHLFHAGGLLHGGVIATLLDGAMSGAVMTSLPPGRGCTTLHLAIDTIRAVRPDAGFLTVTGETTHCGQSTGFASGTITDAAGRLYARGTTNCLVFDRQGAAIDTNLPGRAHK